MNTDARFWRVSHVAGFLWPLSFIPSRLSFWSVGHCTRNERVGKFLIGARARSIQLSNSCWLTEPQCSGWSGRYKRRSWAGTRSRAAGTSTRHTGINTGTREGLEPPSVWAQQSDEEELKIWALQVEVKTNGIIWWKFRTKRVHCLSWKSSGESGRTYKNTQ